MPYKVVKSGSKFVVQKADGSRTFGTHDTEKEADAQMAALYASEKRHAESRDLHLLGATGEVRTEMIGSKEHLVVPVVALMEGVIHAVNAETPEFVPLDTLKKAAESWNGKPVTLGHPKKDGKQCSAQDPGIIEAHGLGTLRNFQLVGKKMVGEALVEKARAKKLHPDMYATLSGGGSIEVSVGALVLTDKVSGLHNGKPYVGSWTFASGDHLAFLPGGKGACSLEMGCGTHRAAMRMCEDHMEEVKVAEAGDATEEEAELIAYQSMRTILDGVKGQYEEISKLVDALIADETESPAETPEDEAAEEQIETARLDAIRALCQSLSSAISSVGSATYCSALSDYPRYMEQRAAAGARHSAKDASLIQAMHDHSMELGASCDRGNMKTAEEKDKNKAVDSDNPTLRYIADVRKRAAN